MSSPLANRNTLIKKLTLLMVILAGIGAFYIFDGAQYLSLAKFQAWVDEQPLLAATGYFVSYVLVVALSLPFATLITVIGGAVFGLWWGVLLVSFASSLGATLACLFSRFLLRDWVQARFGKYLASINEGVKREGAFYLFSLRLIPVFPFFAINLVFGLTPIKTWTFYWVSQLGMLAGTIVYVNFGAQLAGVEEISVSGVLTPKIIAAFILLAMFPWIVKTVMKRVRRRLGKDSLERTSKNSLERTSSDKEGMDVEATK